MTLLTISPAQLPGTGTPLDLTAAIAGTTALGSNTGVSFANTGREILFVSVAAGGSTATVPIGTTIEGQAVTSLGPYTLTASHTSVIGHFPADEDFQGGLIEVTFGTPANVTYLLIQS